MTAKSPALFLLWFLACYCQADDDSHFADFAAAGNHPVTTTTPSSSISLRGSSRRRTTETNNPTDSMTPVIGVLSQPYTSNTSFYYIAASYIKWLEGAGARTIAIPYHIDDDDDVNFLDELFHQIHMIFLPGGDSLYPASTLNYLLTKAWQHDVYFPVWGTCLGFEFLIQYVAADSDKPVLEPTYDSHNVSLSLEQVVPVELYKKAHIYKTVTTTNTTFNNHHVGIQPHVLAQHPRLSHAFQITSINHDANGKAFVSTIEPRQEQQHQGQLKRRHAFYGVQYHPEKNAYEYATYPNMPNVPYQAIDHSATGIQFSQHVAEFVVQRLARQSLVLNYPHHDYTNPQNRFPPVYTYPLVATGLVFEQVYLIPVRQQDKNENHNKISDKVFDKDNLVKAPYHHR